MSTEQEEQVKTDQEAINQYFSDPDVKARHVDAANQLYALFKDQWFTISKITEKTLMKDKQQAAQLMMGLRMFNLCDAQDRGVGHKRRTHFRITLLKEERLKVLQNEKDKLLKQLEFLDKDIQKIEQEEDLLKR